MIDCEMSGVNVLKDQILQVAMIKLQKNGTQYDSVEEKVWYFKIRKY